MDSIPLLLTATINPLGMQGAHFSPKERALMYADALNFYIRALSNSFLQEQWTIVLAENSGSDPESILSLIENHSHRVRVEYLNVGREGFDNSRGKGFNEFLLIEQAIERSEAISAAGCFFKLTGRIKVLNIVSLLRECLRYRQSKNGLRFLADCKDHHFYEMLRLPINGHAGECRYWFSDIEIFREHIIPELPLLNDYPPTPYLAEDLMLCLCREVEGRPGCRVRFRTQARISGKGGHHLGKGWSFFYSTDNDSWILRLKCSLRQLLRWLIPMWKV